MLKSIGRNKKTVYMLLGIAACALFYFLPAPQSLSRCAEAAGSDGATAMRVLGAVVLAIIWWVGEVFPHWMTTITMLLLWVMLGKMPFSTAFASYTGSTVWLIIGAFCLAKAVTNTGLFNRITLGLIRIFSPAFSGQVLALLLVGTVCAPLIPSAAAKAVLGATLAQKTADAMLLPPKSRERCGLFMAAFIGFCITTPAFLSGSMFTYALYGVLPQSISADISWISWLVAMLPWLIILLVSSYLFIRMTASPKKDECRITLAYAKEEYAKLGKMRGCEKKAAALLASAVLLWVFQNVVHIEAGVTAMLAALFCFALKLLDTKEISTAVPWPLVLHIGGVINLGMIFPAVGLDSWIQSLIMPLFREVYSPFAAIAAVFVLTLLVRTVMVSQNAVVVMLTTLLALPLAASGMSQWAVGLVIVATGSCWLLPFQNTVFISALACTEDTLTHRQTVKYALFFEVFSLLAFFVSVPYWRMLGLIA